jgi:transcriptional regulator with XRE-family HTH domain
MAGRKQRDSERFRKAFRALGERIATQRRDRHMTQESLAERAGLSVTAVSDIERADAFVALESLFLVARALEVSVAQLVDGLDAHITDASAFVTFEPE